MPKPIAIILLNWNTKFHSEACIRSIYKHADHAIFDIIFADNGSTDGSIANIKSNFPDVIILENKFNLGFAEGNNRAIDLSLQMGYQYSMLMNTDTLIETDLITQLFHFLQHHEQIAAVQPAIYYTHQKDKLWNGELKFNVFWGYTYSAKVLPKKPKEVDWITGCCFLVKNKVLQNGGKFNDKYFLYYEDVELSFRWRLQGYKLYILPNAVIYHEAGVSSQLKKKKKEGTLSPIIHYYLNRNRIWFLRSFGNKFCYIFNFLNLIAYWCALLFYFLFKLKFQKAKYLLKGIFEGFFTSSY
nr:glycosyltransferase family 2 protein [Pseudopedobacter sp.]